MSFFDSLFGKTAWLTEQECWGTVVYQFEDGLVNLMFSTYPHSRDPVLLDQWYLRAMALQSGEATPSTAAEAQYLSRCENVVRPGTVGPMVDASNGSPNLFIIALPVPADARLWGYDEGDPNRTVFSLCCSQRRPFITGLVNSSAVAWERLVVLNRRGAQPVVAVLVQANRLMYEPNGEDCPGLVVFSFNQQATLDLLQSTAKLLMDLKTSFVNDPTLQAAAQRREVALPSSVRHPDVVNSWMPGVRGGRVVPPSLPA